MHNSSLFASLPGLALLLGLVIAAAYFGATIIAAFLLLIFLLCASACLWSRGVLDKTSISLGDGQTACHAGDTLQISLQIRSRSFFPLIWLDVILPFGETAILRREGDAPDQTFTFITDKPFYGLRERFVWLLWQQEIACEESLLTLRRGVVTLSRACLQAGDGLGMAAAQRYAEFDRPVRLLVYPRIVRVDVQPFLRLITDAEAGARGQTEDITLLKSIRPYQHGDSMKRINWRYLAMTGRMEVNQYETITPGCITFFVDLYSFRYIETYTTASDYKETRVAVRQKPLEDMLSLIASCIRALHERGKRFALAIPGYADHEPVLIKPSGSDGAYDQAMEALAEIDYRGQAVALPGDDIRRLRRKLGSMHLCAYTDASRLAEPLDALGCHRPRIIACHRDDSAQPSGECILLEDLVLSGGEGGGA